MGIEVRCPYGHEFRVKEKYAGKKGLCPYCKGQVSVRVPDSTSSEQLKKAALRAVAQEHEAATAASSSSVFEDPHPHDEGTSGSLLSSSVVRHNIKCHCGERVPMWFARCPKCGEYIEH